MMDKDEYKDVNFMKLDDFYDYLVIFTIDIIDYF
jgi:hypothetical protein